MIIKKISKIIIIGIAITCYPGVGFSIDGRELILQNKTLNDQITTKYERAILSTCKYEFNKKKAACTESSRVKEYESVTKYYSRSGTNGKRELKNVRVILNPISDRGLGMLNYGYQNNNKDDDSWIYFSSLGKVRRITTSEKDRNEPQSGSLFGSEYSTEDLASTPIDDYSYKIIKSTKIENRSVSVIEKIPSIERLRKSNYSKSIVWIDLERKTILKILKYNLQGKPIKLYNATHWENIDGIWMPQRQSVINLITKRKSSLKIVQRKLNIPVDNENYFSQRILLDKVFRERFFKTIKKAM